MAARTRFIDYLPAVFRQDEVQEENFLGRFLRAFESAFEPLQAELDAIPTLFALTPTPALSAPATRGKRELTLESAAGICPGDVLQIDSDPSRIEFAAVHSLPDGLLRQSVTLDRDLRFDHPPGAAVRPTGSPGRATRLDLSVDSGETTLVIRDAVALGIGAGSVLRIDEGALQEFVRVRGVTGPSVTVVPPLERAHEVGQPVFLLRPAAATTPSPIFTRAASSGPELVLLAHALPGETLLEIDTVMGLQPGDVLHLQEIHPEQTEFARVKQPRRALSGSGPGVERRALELEAALRFEHVAGTALGVLGESACDTRLADPVTPPARSAVLAEPDRLDLRPGMVLQVGEGAGAEYTQVISITGRTVTLLPELRRSHMAGDPVIHLAPAGSGTAFLGWLASWIGLSLRADRGERWNRELLRRSGGLWPHRGTRLAVAAYLDSYLLGEATATVTDLPDALQIGVASTIGEDTYICGGLPPHTFLVELVPDPGVILAYGAEGRAHLIQAAIEALRQEKPAHTSCSLRLQQPAMQIGNDSTVEIGVRVGDTTILGGGTLVIDAI